MGRFKKYLLVHRINIRKARQYRNHDSDSEDIPIINNNKYDLEDEKKADLTNNMNLSNNDEIEDQLDYESENDPTEYSEQ
ncbi:29806_t:CDS:2, partial [Racocetra persica]